MKLYVENKTKTLINNENPIKDNEKMRKPKITNKKIY